MFLTTACCRRLGGGFRYTVWKAKTYLNLILTLTLTLTSILPMSQKESPKLEENHCNHFQPSRDILGHYHRQHQTSFQLCQYAFLWMERGGGVGWGGWICFVSEWSLGGTWQTEHRTKVLLLWNLSLIWSWPWIFWLKSLNEDLEWKLNYRPWMEIK